MHRLLALSLCLTAPVLLGACGSISASAISISDSVSAAVTSVSDSVSGLSDSSRSPSDGSQSKADAAYRADVRVYTRSAARSASLDDAGPAFARELSRIAERHGVSHWEGRAVTYVAIGAGLREAGLTQDEVDLFLARTVRAGEREQSLALEGYRAAAL
jgi:hypothetical protein